MPDPADRRTIHVEISNLTRAQAIAIEDLLATWQSLGSLGASRWTSFFADGDGNFRPKCSIDGRKAEVTALLTKDERWTHSEPLDLTDYRIDFDRIAWKLREANHDA